ncbi:MAG: DUF2958 domain-containing protein [Clostridia bacterium]|jgi:hypothetical protein
MKLLTKAIEKIIPALLSQDGKGENTMAYVKFFLGSFTWYATEYSPEEKLFFGKTFSHMSPEGELGYFSLDELSQVKNRYGCGVERDLYFKPTLLKDCENPCLSK